MINPNRKPIRRKKSYDQWANAMSRKWGISRGEFNAHPYDYAQYYKDNYDEAWEHVNNKLAPYQHFPDRYKTSQHPTFSGESDYSGKFGIYNPSGIRGGHWAGDDGYVFDKDQINYKWPIDKTAEYVSQQNVKLYTPHGKQIQPKYSRGKDDDPHDDIWLNGNRYTYDQNSQRYVNGDNQPVQFAQGGILPEAVVTPSTRWKLDNPVKWKDIASNLYVDTPKEAAVRNTTPTMDAINAITGGMLNRLSASQNLRLGYDLLTGNFADAGRGFVYGNNGVVSDSFAQEHPYWSMLINGATDVGVIGGLGSGRQLNRFIASSENPNMQYVRYAIGKTKGFLNGQTPQLPRLYRKIKGVPTINNGRMILSTPENRFAFEFGFGEQSPLITNFTTDVGVRRHPYGNWNYAPTISIPGETLLGKRVISTRPSDTFTYGDNVSIPIDKAVAITGRSKEMKNFNNLGIKTLTSPEAQAAFVNDLADFMLHAKKARLNNAKIAQARSQGKHTFLEKWPEKDFDQYASEIQKITRSNFRAPTVEDYKFMDYVFNPQYTSEVIPKVNLTKDLNTAVLSRPFGSWYGDSSRRRLLEDPNEWKNVMYDPFTPVEAQFRRSKGIDLKPDRDKLAEIFLDFFKQDEK